MTAIIIFWAKKPSELIGHLDGGIYHGITYEQAAAELGELNILYFIPLQISGFTYQEKKAECEHLAKIWQESNGEFIGWSYGELATIQEFFERNGKRYGLLKEFRENAIC